MRLGTIHVVVLGSLLLTLATGFAESDPPTPDCFCRDDTQESDSKQESANPDRDRMAASSPYESCRRQGNRAAGCQCPCDACAERKTGPYGDRPGRRSGG